MNTTASEIADFAHKTIDWLTQLPGRNNKDVYTELAKYSGISASRIRDFHSGVHPNLTVETLDQLVEGVKQAMRKTAA